MERSGLVTFAAGMYSAVGYKNMKKCLLQANIATGSISQYTKVPTGSPKDRKAFSITRVAPDAFPNDVTISYYE
jgi:hypothetical protein